MLMFTIGYKVIRSIRMGVIMVGPVNGCMPLDHCQRILPLQEQVEADTEVHKKTKQKVSG